MAPLHGHHKVEAGDRAGRGHDVCPVSVPEDVGFGVENRGFLCPSRDGQQGDDGGGWTSELHHAFDMSLHRHGEALGTQRALPSHAMFTRP